MTLLLPILIAIGMVLPIIAVAAIVIAVMAVGARQADDRRKAMADFAARHGLEWRPDRDPTIDERFPRLACLRNGRNRYAYNVCYGRVGGSYLWAFDYHYETQSTDSKGNAQTDEHHLSVVVIQTCLPLEPLYIRPENFLDRVGAFFGMDDIDFESAAFSKRFCVRAANRRWAYDVITQETMEILLASPGYTISMDNGRIAVYDGTQFTPDEFDSAMSVGRGILERLPRSVLQEIWEDA